MKKVGTAFAILFVFLAVAFGLESKPKEVKQSQIKIGVLTLMRHPALDAIYKGFKEELAKEGYRDGKEIKLDYQNANNDQSNLKTMAEKLVNGDSKVLFGITTPSSQALANATKKTPIVLGAVTDPKSANLVKHVFAHHHAGSRNRRHIRYSN